LTKQNQKRSVHTHVNEKSGKIIDKYIGKKVRVGDVDYGFATIGELMDTALGFLEDVINEAATDDKKFYELLKPDEKNQILIGLLRRRIE